MLLLLLLPEHAYFADAACSRQFLTQTSWHMEGLPDPFSNTDNSPTVSFVFFFAPFTIPNGSLGFALI